MDAANINTQASNITSSPAMEVNFSMMNGATSSPDDSHGTSHTKGSATCGNIVFHYLIPNTLLVLIAFSSGYFVLVDWVNGVILSDEDIVKQAYCSAKGLNSAFALPGDFPRDHNDNVLLDVAYHVPTSTVACLTHDGNIVLYHIRIMDGCHDLKGGDCACTSGIVVSTRTHTRPKAKASSSPKRDTLMDCDSSIKRTFGTIDFLCAHRMKSVPVVQPDTRRGDLINFSSDGESISISLGDESVSILSINVDDAEADCLKQRLAETIYLGKDNVLTTIMMTAIVAISWYWNKYYN